MNTPPEVGHWQDQKGGKLLVKQRFGGLAKRTQNMGEAGNYKNPGKLYI